MIEKIKALFQHKITVIIVTPNLKYWLSIAKLLRMDKQLKRCEFGIVKDTSREYTLVNIEGVSLTSNYIKLIKTRIKDCMDDLGQPEEGVIV